MIRVLKRNIPLLLLCIYFTSKMLWDKLIPGIIEVVSLMAIAWGVFQFCTKGIGAEKLKQLGLFFVFSVYVVLNALTKDTLQQGLRACYEYIFYAAMLFGLAYYIQKTDIYRLAKVLNAWGIILSFLSWYEWSTRSYLITPLTQVVKHGTYSAFRAAVFTRSFLSHGVILGFFSVVAFFLFASTYRIRYLCSSVFCFVSILTTSSRGPLVATGCALLVMFVLIWYRRFSGFIQRCCLWLVMAFVGLFALFLLTSSFVTGNETIDYFLYRIRQIINWTGDAGNVGRIMYWNQAIEWFRSSIWFGIGASKTGSWGSGSIGITESGVLKHLCEFGIVGFSLYYLLILRVIGRSIGRYKCLEKNQKAEAILYYGLITIVLINNVILQSTEEIMVSFVFWFGMGGLFVFNCGVGCTK